MFSMFPLIYFVMLMYSLSTDFFMGMSQLIVLKIMFWLMVYQKNPLTFTLLKNIHTFMFNLSQPKYSVEKPN